MPGLALLQIGQKFTIYQMIYVINELVSGKKFTNARSLLSSGLLSQGSTVVKENEKFSTIELTDAILGRNRNWSWWKIGLDLCPT